MSSIFTSIVKGDIPCHKLAEDDRFLAFLDIRPMAEGHALVIPKQEVDYFFDLDDALLKDLMVFAKRVARALERVVPCKRVGMIVAGLEVPHAHMHLVPFSSMGQLNFANAKPADNAALAALAAKVRAAL
ncbi:MAG: HIT family protein [Lentisphaerae bacterium]|nr:HIT family protein [Lentisphaerota bacterium]